MQPSSNLRPEQKGFALVATILLMVLLTILALGMLNLSTVSIRTTGVRSAEAEARANARMALMVAIGRLQAELGPDQRISANGAIVTDSTNPAKHPHWTGVWDSWKAGDSSTGSPDGFSAHSTIGGVSDTGMAPTYQPNREDHFRSWLVSVDPTQSKAVLTARDLELTATALPEAAETAVKIVAAGSLGTTAPNTDHVAVPLVTVKNEAGETVGRYGWWVGDESQKARVMDDSFAAETSLTAAEKIYRGQAPASTGTKVVNGLENITDDTQLDALSSQNTLDLVTDASGRPSQTNFHHISTVSNGLLADVREGGLKRDLNTILEQPINLANQGPEYMLYEFDDPRFPYLNNPNDARRANSRVPIQDLAAYYQLYDDQPAFANGRRGGVQYSSSALSNSLQVNVPDYDGGTKNQQLLNREYTSLYRRPVVTKVQFLLGVTAQEITQAEIDRFQDIIDEKVYPQPYTNNPNGQSWRNNLTANPLRSSDTHRLRLGIQPLVTLWNPTNLPLVMNSPEIMTYTPPPFGIRIAKYRGAATTPVYTSWMNLSYANTSTGSVTAGQGTSALLRVRLGNNAIVFQPGEVKVFSLPSTSATNLTAGGGTTLNLDRGTTFNVVNEWDPFGAFLMRNSAPAGPFGNSVPEVFTFTLDNNAQCLVFSSNDRISVSVDSENVTSSTNMRDGRNSSRDSEIRGAGFGLHMVDEGYIVGNPQADALRHNFMISRHGSGTTANRQALGGFYQELMRPGFPGGVTPLPEDTAANAIPASQIIIASELPEPEIIALMDFSLSIGCETASGASGGFGGGRRIASRPFLHSATGAMPFISRSEKDSLYDYGWDWQLSKINTVEDSILQAKPGTGNGYYGGGYTVENGTTHAIQREIPVLPPISIASLSHAHLGGFSMAKAIPVGENPDTEKYNWNQPEVQNPTGVSFQRVTASGQNGLAPHIVQAIGNSYAHPNIPADKAFVTKARTFDVDEGVKNVPFVDHSYLANKALWDEYFFSSITPQPSKVELFGGTTRTAKQVAEGFFFDGEPLPNRRITPYTANLDQVTLDTLFTEAGLFTDGLADKIASHLMVEGAFNVNSTSVEAWKTLLSSLRGKPVAYLTSGKVPSEANPTGTPVSPNSLPNAAPISSDQISSPNEPAEQWTGGRELTDPEIDALAKAIVHQVKLRGPFLSLSDFINRRLEGESSSAATENSVKGALQAALDDPGDPADPVNRPEVTINASFREPGRTLDTEVAGIGFAFQKAATGPAAYGSAAYVDQADVLRGLAAQLTPRGDTYVIRSYGDSIDASGKVVARVWCEATVQRLPEYVDPAADEPQTKQADLSSGTNERYGRKFQIVSFRWLNASEV